MCADGHSGFEPEEQGRFSALRLSRRETEVVALVARGLRNAEIAIDLSLSPRTVQAHVASARRKTGTRSRVHLAVVALCLGLVRCEHLLEGERKLGTSAH